MICMDFFDDEDRKWKEGVSCSYAQWGILKGSSYFVGVVDARESII